MANKPGIWMAALTVTALLLAAGCAGTKPTDAKGSGASTAAAQSGKTYNFKLGHALAIDHPVHPAALAFAKGVEAGTNGRVKIEVVGAGALGSEKDEIEQVRAGGLAIAILSGGAHAFIDQKATIEELPYAFSDHQHAYAAMDGDLGKKVTDLMDSKGLHILGFMENGFRNMTNNTRPITKPGDLRGLKVRSAEVPMRIDMFKMFGASPTAMAFTELFTALQQKTVDGQENPLAIIYSSKFYEVQKYLSITNHIWGSMYLEINANTWKSLPPDIQKVINDEAAKAIAMERKAITDGDQDLLGKLKDKGMQVNQADVPSFQAAVQPLWEQYTPTFGADWMTAVKKYAK
jgi:tripartite ATP-independent transporter DctP family solute receptor